MKKIEELSEKLNTFRMANKGKAFTTGELVEKLHSLGFNTVISKYLLKYFPYEREGVSKIFEMPKEPIHMNIISSLYNKTRNFKVGLKKTTNMDETKALQILQSKGYVIKKVVGFDMEKFKLEQPVMYRKYLKYEIL